MAKTLKKFPIVNSSMKEDRITIFKEINIGVAVSVEDGLIVPVIKDADKKDIVEITDQIREVIEKTRKRQISVDELQDGTFTITNLGGFGVDQFTPIINPPQAAILGIGKITERPIVVDGKRAR